MGIRVRKLARELRQSPRDVLQLLKSLGFERYQSPEDMISDTVAARVRSSAPSSGPRRAADPGRARPTRASATPATTPSGDLMAQLVPGVTRTRPDQRGPTTPRAAEDAALHRKRDELTRQQAAVEAERKALAAERAALRVEQEALVEQQHRLEALTSGLEAERGVHAAEVEAFESARSAFVAEQRLRSDVATPQPNLVALLRERGLRGIDEAQRALGALALSHALGPVLKDLTVADDAAFRQILQDRLVLVGGEVPDGLGMPGVSVSADRADLPGTPVLLRAATKLGEQWMLHGFRIITLVGVPPRWHALVRSLVDPRISLAFLPPSAVLPDRPGPSEAWFVWGPPREPAPAARAFFIVPDGDLVSWFLRATQALEDTK